MPYPSPADEERNGGCGPILAAVVLLFIVLAAASCASQAMGAQDVTVRQARTDGPIYDLPEGIGQEIVCDERNREYLLLTTEQGIAINDKGQALDNDNKPMPGLYVTGDMSGSFFANNYPCLMAGVAMGRTLTFAMKAIKQMAGIDNV